MASPSPRGERLLLEILHAAAAGEQVGIKWDPGKSHGERGRFEVIGTKQPAFHLPARDQPATMAEQGLAPDAPA